MVPLFSLSAGRFALLRHEMPPHHSLASHWDLMFDTGDLLLTFRLFQLCESAPCWLAATRLPEHRRIYLEYEGAVSGGRGTVFRMAAGDYRVLVTDSGENADAMAVGAPPLAGAAFSAVETSGRARTCVRLTSPTLQARLEFEHCQVHEDTLIRVLAWS